MDFDNNDIISNGEYNNFKKFFIDPFEKYDENHDGYLNEAEL